MRVRRGVLRRSQRGRCVASIMSSSSRAGRSRAAVASSPPGSPRLCGAGRSLRRAAAAPSGRARAEEAGVGARVGDAVVADRPRDRDAGRHRPGRREVRDDRADDWESRCGCAVRAARPASGRFRRSACGRRTARGLLLGCVSERTMATLSVCWASSGIWSQIWMPGTTVSIGLEQAADAVGRVGLQVPHVLLRRPAPQVQQDARSGPLPRRGACPTPALQRGRAEPSRLGSASARVPPGPSESSRHAGATSFHPISEATGTKPHPRRHSSVSARNAQISLGQAFYDLPPRPVPTRATTVSFRRRRRTP